MKRNPQRLTESTFDLLIIGGGINGAGSARDAALRGLKVALIDKSDFASGTSSASSHLVHGGVRYLEQFALGLVHESLRERKTLLEIAPHIVHPLRFHIPVYQGQKKGRFILGCGLTLYDLLAGSRNIGKHRTIDEDSLCRIHPDLRREGLKAGLEYYDALMDDARLCLANVIDADRHGAVAANYIEAIAVQTDPSGQIQITAKDALNGQSCQIRARSILNTTGPWSDLFLGRVLNKSVKRLETSKGIHLIFKRPICDSAMLLFAPDNRIFFVIPFYGHALVGTTDTPFVGTPDDLTVLPEEIEYLIKAISPYFGGADDWRRSLVGTFAGLRPLVAQGDKGTYRTSREHLLVEDQPGFFTLVGGKYTTYRAMTQQAVDAVCKYLKCDQPCVTHQRPLPGGAIGDFAAWADEMDRQLKAKIPDDPMRRYLLNTFGSEAADFVKTYADSAELMTRIDPALAIPRAMEHHAREQEMAITDEDILRRRTPLRLLGYRGSLKSIG
jgi:glycerol-3-phosphate dehydrogenase